MKIILRHPGNSVRSRRLFTAIGKWERKIVLEIVDCDVEGNDRTISSSDNISGEVMKGDDDDSIMFRVWSKSSDSWPSDEVADNSIG